MPHHVVVNNIAFQAKLHKNVSHAKHILARDQARARMILASHNPWGPGRAQHILHAHKRHHHGHHEHGGTTDPTTDPTTTPAPGQGTDPVTVEDASVTYNCSIYVGADNEQHDLLIDTGSSNTWLGNVTNYSPSSTSTDLRKTFQLSYGSGSIQGECYQDTVTIGDKSITQIIGVADRSEASGFNDVDGILGIGPVDLTNGTVEGLTTVPTVTDNMFSEGAISTEAIGISYVPTTDTSTLANGELVFGGVDQSKFTGTINYVPITKTSPASEYWGIDQTVTYGKKNTALLGLTAGIVDTGTTLLMLASEAFSAYQKATGATMDNSTGLLKLTASQFSSLQSMNFKIGSVTYEFPADAQIWPRSMNSVLGGEDDGYYCILADMGSPSGEGLDFINGFAWLQRYYAVFDTSNSQVGIATTQFTDDTSNQAA